MFRSFVYLWAVGTCVRAVGDCEYAANREEGVSYTQEVLHADAKSVVGLIVNWKTNHLYYSYYNSSINSYVPVAMDAKTKTLTVLEGLKDICEFAVDQLRGDVFAGCLNNSGHGGLYHLDSNVGRFELVGAKGKYVRFVHYADDALYYSSFYTPGLHVYVHGETHLVPEVTSLEVYGLVVDGGGKWVFGNSTGVWRSARGGSEAQRFSGVNPFQWWSTTVSPKGDVFLCSKPIDPTDITIALYQAEVDATLRHLVYAPGCRNLAVDASGGFIYADNINHKIVRLTKYES